MRYTDNSTREKILNLHDKGYTQREIAKLVYVSPSTVNFWINRQGNINPLKRTGRKRKTTKEQDDEIYTLCTKNPFLPATNINRDLNLNLSPQTVRNRLKERGLQNFSAPVKPLLTDSRKIKRLEFAYRYMHWTPEKWEKICFVDEKTFQSYGMGFTRVWRPKLSRWTDNNCITRMHNSFINERQTSSRFSVPVWGCIGKMNHIHLIQEKHLNQIYYLKILKKYFSDDEDITLVQDNSPIHNAKKVKVWLENNNITVLKWPAYSPDLNPIENLWSRMEYLMQNRKPKDSEELWQLVKSTFDEIVSDEQYIKNLVHSMPKRLKHVYDTEGCMTKY